MANPAAEGPQGRRGRSGRGSLTLKRGFYARHGAPPRGRIAQMRADRAPRLIGQEAQPLTSAVEVAGATEGDRKLRVRFGTSE